MTLGELAKLVCLKAHRNDDTALSEAKAYLRARYELIWNAQLWRDSLCEIVIPANDVRQVMILPGVVDRVVSVIFDDTPLGCETVQVVYRIDPRRLSVFDSAPSSFHQLPPSAVADIPGGAQIKVTADSAGASAKVSVRGLFQAEEISETLTLNGLGYVFTEQPFDEIWQLSRDAGPYTVRAFSSDGRELVKLPEGVTHRPFQRIQLHGVPSTPKPMRVLAKRRIRPLVEDSDSPELTGIDNALLAYAIADLLEGSRQFGKAQVKFAEGATIIQQMARLEREQSAGVPRIIPDGIEPCYHAEGYF